MQSYACAVHGPITFPGSQPMAGHKIGLNDFVQALIDTDAVQRLRWIRQNGLCHFVFNTMEHSRFTHSLGVAFVARRMVDRIILNSDIERDNEEAWTIRYQTIAAALIHDIGHGPFSHTLEEILNSLYAERSCGLHFNHEEMTHRIVTDKTTSVHRVLSECHPELPERVAAYFDESKKNSKRWFHKIVSSQLDADRLDYILRDAQMAGLMGAGYDLDRILQHLFIKEKDLASNNFILDRKAIEALESALLVNDQLYRAVYYHRKVRSATAMLKSLLMRAGSLSLDAIRDDHENKLFPDPSHPLLLLFQQGGGISPSDYLRLTENSIWSLIERWKDQPEIDSIVRDYAKRLWLRKLHKSERIDGHDKGKRREETILRKLRTCSDLKELSPEDIQKYYVLDDTSRRKSYKDGDSIYLGNMADPKAKDCALEFDHSSRIITMLKDQHTIEYVVYPDIGKIHSDISSEGATSPCENHHASIAGPMEGQLAAGPEKSIMNTKK